MHNTQVLTYRLDVDKRMIHTKELLNTKETSLANVKVLKQRASHTHISIKYIYSEISDQRTLWGQYKFTCFVPCREVVQIVLLLRETELSGPKKCPL